MSKRDSQKSKLYRAENEFLDAHGRGDRKMSIEECQAFLDWIQSEKWFKARFGKRNVRVKAAHKNSRCSWGWHGGDMELTVYGRFPGLIVHELGHCLGVNGEEAHGPVFCGRYATLVYHVWGRNAETLLLSGYEKERIKHSY